MIVNSFLSGVNNDSNSGNSTLLCSNDDGLIAIIDDKFVKELLENLSRSNIYSNIPLRLSPKVSSYRYINNNYLVSMKYDKLTKRAFRVGEDLIGEFPDSIDLKITNKCKHGCLYCHEDSCPNGDSFDFKKTTEILSQLPNKPIEVAIGGGNVLEIPEKLAELLVWCNKKEFRTRLTINIKDINKLYEIGYYDCSLLEKILFIPDAIGVSINSISSDCIKYNIDPYRFGRSQLDYNILGDINSKFYTVYHIIAGVFPYNDLNTLITETNYPVLILGYKQWGRAKDKDLPPDLEKFEKEIKRIIYNFRAYGQRKALCFDNLALEQLHIKDALSPQELEDYYMGNEGTCSMYIDAVKGEFARTSRDADRVSWDSIGLLDFFKSLRS